MSECLENFTFAIIATSPGDHLVKGLAFIKNSAISLVMILFQVSQMTVILEL